MKKVLLLNFLLLLTITLSAQSTALDFEKPDCAGTNHHLFAELDSGYVCILEFVMMGCQPCVIASNALKTIHAQFEASHPGKVRFYSMGFSEIVKCGNINNWKTVNNFNHTVFDGVSEQVNYYGGMGMPTIVVLGGLSEHKVYYRHQGYTSNQNTPITNAIDLAIGESNSSGVGEMLDKAHFNVFPNPFDDVVTLEVQGVEATHISLMDLAGKEILRQEIHLESGSLDVNLMTQTLLSGFYLVALYDGERQIGLQKLIKE